MAKLLLTYEVHTAGNHSADQLRDELHRRGWRHVDGLAGTCFRLLKATTPHGAYRAAWDDLEEALASVGLEADHVTAVLAVSTWSPQAVGPGLGSPQRPSKLAPED